MAKAAKRLSRVAPSRKSLPDFPVSDAAREFRRRCRQYRATMHRHTNALPENASRKALREARAKDDAARVEHEAFVEAYLSRFYGPSPGGGEWHEPRPLRSMADVVELAVAGLDHVAPSRALCVAICRAAGIRML